MAEILGIQTIEGVWIINTDTDPRLAGGTSAPRGSLCIASDGTGSFFKAGSTNGDWINISISLGTTKTFFYSTDFETGAVPAGWNASAVTGGTSVYTQAAETGVIGLALLQTTAAVGSRIGLKYSNAVNFLLSFLDSIYTQQIFKVRWNGSIPVSDVVHAFGWMNTNAPATPAGLGNTLAIMYDPSNTSGFNPGLITNLFLIARGVYGVAGTTVVDLGVAPSTSWNEFQIIYDNVLNEVRVYRDTVLLTTLTDLTNVPGGSVKGAIPVAANAALQPTIYLSNSTTIAPTSGSGLRVDKHTTYKIYS